jgi:ribokinase
MDAWSHVLHSHLDPSGIDLGFVTQKPSAGTGLIFITVTPDGQRTMISYRGANVLFEPDDLPANGLEGAALLQLSGYAFMQAPQCNAACQAVQMARSADIPISLDLPLEPILRQPQMIDSLLDQLTLCVLGSDELIQLTGLPEAQAVACLLSRGIRRLAVKKGTQGCLLAETGRSLELPIFPVKTLDSTGAGDAFCAGFIAGWLLGLDLPSSGILASALGALATTVVGGSTSLPGLAEVVQFLQNGIKAPANPAFQPWVTPVLVALQPD